MAYTALGIPPAPASTATMHITKEQNGLSRSQSTKDLCKHSTIRRSYSDNHLCYSINSIRATSVQPKLKSSQSMGIFPLQQLSDSILPNSLRPFLFDPETSKDMNMEEKGINVKENMVESSEEERINRANWVQRLIQIKRHWSSKLPKESMDPDKICNHNTNEECDCDENDNDCVVGYEEEEEEEDVQEMTYDRDSFSKFLVPVPWSDTKLYSQLAFLSNMAYVIPQIKAKDLRRYYGLQFVTSSLEKKAEVAKIKAKLDQDSIRIPIDASVASQDGSEKGDNNEQKHQIKLAYDIAALAASYVQSRAKDLLSLASKSQKQSGNEDFNGKEDSPGKEVNETSQVYKSEVAAYVAASTMTAVVAACEKEKQEAAKDLQSLRSSPCEWFVCDDSCTYTRCFVIQGSDSLASWLANLFFEPTIFEGTDILVHRGIYEAAKGIYEQFMPEIMDHLKRYGDRAKLQFTGHSLGGSLSLLVHLMLLTRKVVRASTLLPVVTFGSPFVFCGGQKLLNELGMDESHIHCVMMHRDIVPRAFSCNYPNHVIIVLKRLNCSFRSHPCLTKNKLLYSPLGKIFIIQPDEKTSPPHPLFPPGSAFYALDNARCGYSPSVLRAFLNQPHPLETLSNPMAYGSDGSLLRDHNCSNYLKALNGVLRQHSKIVVRRVRKQRSNELWPLLISPSPHSHSHDQNLGMCSVMTKEIISRV